MRAQAFGAVEEVLASVKRIETKAELDEALMEASELEHALMCQYLFAAFTMKRNRDEGLGPVDLEWVRRWGARLTLIARQEMEHLGLVMNMRAAIGAQPTFRRRNFPQALWVYAPSGIKMELTRHDPDTVKRFIFFEEPHPPYSTPCSLSPDEARAMRDERLGIAHAFVVPKETKRLLRTANGDPIPFESVQALYLSIQAGFRYLNDTIGPAALFTGDRKNQIWGGPNSPYEQSQPMDDLNQYGIDLIEVYDLPTASQAIDMILQQGEGVFAPPEYVEFTHYCMFEKTYGEMMQTGVVAYRPVVANPLVEMHPDITAPSEVNLITHPVTKSVASLANEVYQVMLELLCTLYGDWDKGPDDTLHLTDAVFFPLMTMFIRPLGETLTQLPAFVDRPGNAGPGFELSRDIGPAPAGQIHAFFVERFAGLVATFDALPWRALDAWPQLASRLRYMQENMARLSADWRDNWQNIGRDHDVSSKKKGS
ncbi:MAG: ferritin-like domain-containing protein [Polyangiales bacterium]